MAGYLLEMFGVSLLLTLILETPLAFALGMRCLERVALGLLVNVLTNPAAVLCCWLGAPQILVEAAVVLVEALVYLWFARDEKWKIRHPVRLSVLCNLVSWSAGILIQRIGG